MIPRRRADRVNTLIFRTVAPFLTALMLLFSVFVLLRGHNEPGGGFIGGLVAAAAFALYGLAATPSLTRRALVFDTRSFIAVGLLVTTLTAMYPMLYGLPVLMGLWGEINILGQSVELGSALFFDIGVYLVVLGVTLTIILSIAEE
jgi:multicomponent Na+:H+ antiporter subunit B